MARSPLRFWASEWDTWPISLSLSSFLFLIILHICMICFYKIVIRKLVKTIKQYYLKI